MNRHLTRVRRIPAGRLARAIRNAEFALIGEKLDDGAPKRPPVRPGKITARNTVSTEKWSTTSPTRWEESSPLRKRPYSNARLELRTRQESSSNSNDKHNVSYETYAENTTALIIDLQEKLVPMDDYQRLIKQSQFLLEYSCRL